MRSLSFERISQIAYFACLSIVVASMPAISSVSLLPLSTYAQVDNEPPEIISTNPAPGATDVPVHVSIQGTFNEELDRNYEENVIVSDQNGNLVPGRVIFSDFREFLF